HSRRGLFRHRAYLFLGGYPEVLHLLRISADRYLNFQAWFADEKLQALPAVEPNPKALEVESGQHGGVKVGQKLTTEKLKWTVRMCAPLVGHMDARMLVPGERIELPTNGLQNRCSTSSLCRFTGGFYTFPSEIATGLPPPLAVTTGASP